MSTETIAFITDTHFGSDGSGFQQQPRRADLLPSIFDSLKSLLQVHNVRLLIHGGDLVETARPEDIQEAHHLLLSLDVPSLVCLGNHDLSSRQSHRWWRGMKKLSPNVQWADTVLRLECVDIIVMNTHWLSEGEPVMYWSPSSDPQESLSETQRLWLEDELVAGEQAGDPARPAVLALHAPLEALPPRLTGAIEPLHVPSVSYSEPINAILDRHPRVKLVLAGHNHVNCATEKYGRYYLSTSSLIEPPFEFRLMHFTPTSFHVETIATLFMTPDITYDPAKTWVSGKTCDRNIHFEW